MTQTMTFQSKTRLKANHQRGMTLIELLLVLLVAGGIFVIVFGYFKEANNQTQVQTAASELALMSKKAQKVFSSQGSYDGATAAVLINLGIPSKKWISGSNIRDPWGNNITVASAGTNNAILRFTYAGVPSDVCSSFVTTTEGSFQRVAVGSTVIKNTGTGTTLSAVTLGTACAGTSAKSVYLDMPL
jgi:prepilin-type N-terminal cleavage/methylation domain-containing protein